jgi:rare lipoprotein A
MNFGRLMFISQNVGNLLVKYHTRSKLRTSFSVSIFASFGVIFLLTSCSTVHRYPVKGLVVSSKAYKINGRWYFPQKFYDYNEVGLASWYGPGFHGLKKAQGELYNQNAMSAAHKTLPLPTVIRVTNTKNNKSVVLLVDDRGPFKNKRIIDLSAAAAKELDLHEKGVGEVKICALGKESNALAMYLKKYGTLSKIGQKKRTWREIYSQEIGCRPGYCKLSGQ